MHSRTLAARPVSAISTLRAGVAYITAGFPVTLMHHPTTDGGCTCGAGSCKHPGKHPRFEKWTTDLISDAGRLRQELRKFPLSNLGIVTGSGTVGLDIDPQHDGDTSLAKLEAEYGKLPTCPTVLTGGGGMHLYFSTNVRLGNSVSKLAPGLDVRGEGGCLVAPPSLHQSGKLYTWTRGRSFSDLSLPPIPQWIIDTLRKNNLPRSTAGVPCNLHYDGFRSGDRNVGMTSLAGKLIGKRVDLMLVLKLLIAFDAKFNKPPLGEDEIRTIVHRIAKRELLKGA
jgi:Bifunctional DNA primase/polymerase, N-terminal/Primase C terminal 1 (PriCT-1)